MYVRVREQEILGVFLAPYVLIKVMPRSAAKIIDFVSRVTVTVPGVGDVCGYSLFDLKKFGTLWSREERREMVHVFCVHSATV